MNNKQRKLLRYFSRLGTYLKTLSPGRRTVLVLILATLLIILRKPSLIIGPQFWAEDGLIFYSQAYNEGLSAIFNNYAGFIQLYMRIVSEIAVHFGLILGPLIFSFGSIIVMLLPLFILWSSPKLLFEKYPYRQLLLFTYLYLLIPHLQEVFGTLTNAGWYLALAAAFCIIRPEKNSKKWLTFDAMVLFISGLTGPYCLFLLLPATLMCFYEKDKKNRFIKLGIVLICCIIQAFVLIGANQKSAYSLNTQKTSIVAEYQRPIKIVGMRFVEVPLLGIGSVNEHIAKSSQSLLFGLFVICLTLVAVLRSNIRIKALIIFSATAFIFSLFRAQTVTVVDFWKMIQYSDLIGQRYFFLPFIVWVVILILLKQQKDKYLTGVMSGALLALFVLVFPASFYISGNENRQYNKFVENFNNAYSGTVNCTSINPDMKMCLKKR